MLTSSSHYDIPLAGIFQRTAGCSWTYLKFYFPSVLIWNRWQSRIIPSLKDFKIPNEFIDKWKNWLLWLVLKILYVQYSKYILFIFKGKTRSHLKYVKLNNIIQRYSKIINMEQILTEHAETNTTFSLGVNAIKV